jgi:hypothetical protein
LFFVAHPLQAEARLVNEAPVLVPANDWLYSVADYFVEAGIVTGYAEDYFDGTVLRSNHEFLDFVLVWFDSVSSLDAPSDSRLAGIDLANLRLRLYERFDTNLEVIAVKQRDRPRWRDGLEPKLDDLLVLTGTDFPISDLQALLAAKAEFNATTPASAYDDVPLESPAYRILDALSRTPILEGYPDSFFGSGTALTRYEFAQAIARLVDINAWDVTEAGELRKSLAAAEVSKRDLAWLIVEFSDQLAELARCG